MPTTGQAVRVHLDTAGFVRRVETVTPAGAPQLTESHRAGARTREHVVTRLAVLSTVRSLLGSGNRPVDPADVLRLAGQLEVWAMRSRWAESWRRDRIADGSGGRTVNFRSRAP